MKERVIIKGTLQQMAQSEVLEMIPSDTLRRVRDMDPHPEFRVFSIGHEGDANANVLGAGMKVLHYAKDIIVQMFNRVKVGLAALYRHDPSTNSHVGRESVGEIVGKTVKEIGGRLHALAAVYIKPEYRDHELDVASIEGDFEAEEHTDGSYGVVNLSEVTGVALSNHRVDTPGMEGATLQAALQMFTQKYGRLQQMDKDQVKLEISKGNFKPEDLFSQQELLGCAPVKEAKQQEYEHSKRIEKKLGESHEENQKLQAKVTELESKNTQLLERVSVGNVKDVFSKVAADKKLDPKFVTFVEKNLKGFKSDKEGDEFKEAVEKFVDGQAKEYVEMGKLYGFEAKVSTESKKEDEGDKGKEEGDKNFGGGSGDDDKGSAASGGDSFTDPKKNDFIPE